MIEYFQHCLQQINTKRGAVRQESGVPSAAQGSKHMKSFDKVTYGVLSILLGGIGVNSFIAGHPGMGILKILFCWTAIPGIIGLIQGIFALCRPESKLIQTGVFSFQGAPADTVNQTPQA